VKGAEYYGTLTICPQLDNSLKLCQAIGQRSRAVLQDQRRFDLVHVLTLHSRYSIEARPRCDTLGPEFLAAPAKRGLRAA